MSRPTYISGARERRFGTASSDARAAALADQLPLEKLEEMAVITKDAARRAELEAAVRLGRIARGGTHDSGGAVRVGSDDAPASGGRVVLDPAQETHDSGGAVRSDVDDAPPSGGRVVLDASLRARLTEPMAAWDASEAAAPEPAPARERRWRLAIWRR